MPDEPVKVEITGTTELRAAIRRAKDTDLQKELRAAHRNVALAVSGRAYQLAPKYTGELANSIRPVSGVASASVSAGNSGVEYAGPIHWGWPRRNIESQPFIADAVKQQWSHIVGYFNDAVDKISDKLSSD